MNNYLLKRPFDILVSASALILTSPILLFASFMVWCQDFKSPFYMARRVACGGGDFVMIKIRSMIVDAEKSGVNSTGNNDSRVTPIGQMIRRYKIDELSQFVNVLKGDMSVVGPRPNTRSWGVDLYTSDELELLSVRPGITDLSSIVFSDEGEILRDMDNPDEAYNQLIRPWKSRLGLLYIEKASLIIDIQIIVITVIATFNKERALLAIRRILLSWDADAELIEVCERQRPLTPSVAPGASVPFGMS